MPRVILKLLIKLTNLILNYKVEINRGTKNYFIKNFLIGHSCFLPLVTKWIVTHYTQATESFNLSL